MKEVRITSAGTNEKLERIADLVESALECKATEWPAFLDRECAGDSAMRAEVESLLRHYDQAWNFIETPILEMLPDTVDEDETGLTPGQNIDGYEILSLLSEGGMGEVYLAREAEVGRNVAIKLLKPGLSTSAILRGFRREERILANLNHPNIARFYGYGKTTEGRPYFVMEYVEGESINQYCDAQELATRERLSLFRNVCAAVHYSHQHLVIHRDIKPGNIIVTADGSPKLLDFGIAKLLDPTQSDTAAHTVTQLGAMTPEYASPEQIRGENVTTATDVYSLGVLLYELLTGQRPYKLKSRAADELAKAIDTQEPEKPSEAKRGDARGPKLLRGDLDNIALKALRKEPQRRYASVEQFSEDIRRHLEGLPVMARKDSFGYRAGKFIRRNKAGVAAGAAVFIVLLGGMATTLWEARAARAQRDRAAVEAAKAARVNEFLQGMFKAADPENKGSEAKVVDVLNDAARRVDAELAAEPEVLAEVHQTIGTTYLSLGLFDAAESQLRSAFDLNRKLFGEEHPATAKSMAYLGWVLYGKGNYAEAELLLRHSLNLQRGMGIARGHDLADTMFALGDLLRYQGNLKEAETLLTDCLADYRRVLGNENEYVATTLNSIALVHEAEGDQDGAEKIYRQSLEVFRQLPYRQRIRLPLTLTNLGLNLTLRGRYDEAESLLREAVDYDRSVVGDSSLVLARPLTALGQLYFERGDYVKAEQITSQALELQQRALPRDSPELTQALSLLGSIFTREGRPTKGEPLLRESLDIRRKALGNDHRLTRVIESALGECLTEQKRFAEAEPLLAESYEALKAILGERHPITVQSLRNIVKLYDSWNKPDQARPYRAKLRETSQ
jgi:serine/threonine-protein kinase